MLIAQTTGGLGGKEEWLLVGMRISSCVLKLTAMMTGMILNILKTIPHFKWMRGKVYQLYIYILIDIQSCWSNQSILKEINPEHSLEGLMLKLKLQYFGHLMRRADSLEKTLTLGKTEGRRRRGMTEDEMLGWHHQLNGHEFEQTPEDSEGQGSLACCSPWGHKESDTTEWLNKWHSIKSYQSLTG